MAAPDAERAAILAALQAAHPDPLGEGVTVEELRVAGPRAVAVVKQPVLARGEPDTMRVLIGLRREDNGEWKSRGVINYPVSDQTSGIDALLNRMLEQHLGRSLPVKSRHGAVVFTRLRFDAACALGWGPRGEALLRHAESSIRPATAFSTGIRAFIEPTGGRPGIRAFIKPTGGRPGIRAFIKPACGRPGWVWEQTLRRLQQGVETLRNGVFPHPGSGPERAFGLNRRRRAPRVRSPPHR